VSSVEKIISNDGTPIALERSGAGAPLVLVHGTNTDHTRWALVRPLLEQHFTLYALDRRGRGESGDAAEYAIAREFEDVAAVANIIEGPVNVFGHSFGAACVLGAARQIHNLGSLILYEPPMTRPQHSPERAALLEKMDQELRLGNREQVVVLLLRDMMNVPAALVERMRATPAWAGQVAAAHTILRELHQSETYAADLEGLKSIRVPALLLLGSESPDHFRVTTNLLHQTLPASQVVVLPGQQHSAMMTAPDLLAQEVIRFLN
jgi:pimeloyl-ACP methyl ester carboxylesterase